MRAIVRRGTWPGLLFALLGLVACGGRPGPAGRLSDAGSRDGGTSLDAAPRDAPAADPGTARALPPSRGEEEEP